MNMPNGTEAGGRQFGWAWVGLTAALALHVTDEAMNDFLSIYNPTVAAIRERLPWLPLPVFTFEVWLAFLVMAVAVLASMSLFAFRGTRRLRGFAYFFAVMMVANGIGHFAGSVYLGRLMPGVYSSPFLLAAAVYLLVRLRKTA